MHKALIHERVCARKRAIGWDGASAEYLKDFSEALISNMKNGTSIERIQTAIDIYKSLIDLWLPRECLDKSI